MRKLILWSTTVILTGVLLFCALCVVVALDELARIPFYNTLPVIAILMNAAWLLIVLRRKRRIKHALSIFAKPALIFGGFYPLSRADVETNNRSRKMPLPQEVEAALRTIHSVAWGFPTRNRLAFSINKERINEDNSQ